MVRLNKDKLDDDVLWLERMMRRIAALPEPKLPPPDITVSTDGTGEMFWINDQTGEVSTWCEGDGWRQVTLAPPLAPRTPAPAPKPEPVEEKPKPRRKLDLSL